MRVSRIQPFGVVIENLPLCGQLSDEQGQALRVLLLEHRLLVFHDVSAGSEVQAMLMRSLGVGDVMQEASNGSGVSLVTNTPGEVDNLEILDATGCRLPWHADYEWTRLGAAAALSLQAVEVFPGHSPTLFADMVAAATRLDRSLHARLIELNVFKAADFSEGTGTRMYQRNRVSTGGQDDPLFYGCERGALERHPVTGQEYLNISEMFTSHVVGWTYEHSDELFDEISVSAYSTDNVYSHRWQPGDLVVWDNVALQHSRRETAGHGRRILRRVVVDPHNLHSHLSSVAPDWETELADRVRRYGRGDVVDLLSSVEN